MRRRSGFGRERGAGGALDRLREAKTLGLSDLRHERLDGLPDDVELATARMHGELPVGVVASRRDGLDLPGWAQVVSAAAGGDPGFPEVVIAAPVLGPATRRAAARLAPRGPALRLVALPSLAEPGDTPILSEEAFPPRGPDLRWGGSPGVAGRIARVIDGAAEIGGAGGARRTGAGWAVYLRGTRVLEIREEGDGAGVLFLQPDRRHVHVNDGSFPRWSGDLHEAVLQLAQDPRLLDTDSARAVEIGDRAAAAARVRITGRWIPWSEDGSGFAPWVGMDPAGRPVVGFVRRSVGLSDVPAMIAAAQALEDGRELWVPGARGPVRLLLSAESVESRVRGLLSSLGLDLENRGPASLPEAAEEAPRRGGRRRSRRRRRGGRGESQPGRERLPIDLEEGNAALEERRGGEVAEPELAGADDAEEGIDEEDLDRVNDLLEEASDFAAPVVEPEPLADEEPLDEEEEDEPESSPEPEALAPEDAESDELVPAPPRRRRSRAALVVRDDPNTILAALVLARDRRNIVFFWVCPQDQLMDFFRGKATDVDENTDLFVVGFTAQPVPGEILASAELFRGRLQWFDHHPWPIEDAERLRAAIGDDSVLLLEDAASSLAAITPVMERRSRFTDKLVDLAARRLSQADMEKWGERVVGLLRRMAATPGDHRAHVLAILSGRPGDLPAAPDVFRAEETWLEETDPRLVHFGEYQLALYQVPAALDCAEVGRRLRLRTGARLSLGAREGDESVVFAGNEEKRHMGVLDLAEEVCSELPWAHARAGGDRIGRIQIDGLAEHPERLEIFVSQLVRNKSILYG